MATFYMGIQERCLSYAGRNCGTYANGIIVTFYS